MPVVVSPWRAHPLVIRAAPPRWWPRGRQWGARAAPMLPPAYQPVVSCAIAWAWAAEAPNRASAATPSITGVLMNVMCCLSWIGCRGSGKVDQRVDHRDRGIERQHAAVDGGQGHVARGRDRRTCLGNDRADHGPAAGSIDRRRAAHLPEHVLGLCAVDEGDALRRRGPRAPDRERR